jgi:peroxisomal 2,4-dienoyl-CoA reductase
MELTPLSLGGSEYSFSKFSLIGVAYTIIRIDRLTRTSKELSEATGHVCIPAQADVRRPEALRDAVTKAIDNFGRIDFVICGAAGNFLAPISGLSENGFKTVMEIDTVSIDNHSLGHPLTARLEQVGTYNTIKATMEHVRASKGSFIHVSATLHYGGPYNTLLNKILMLMSTTTLL